MWGCVQLFLALLQSLLRRLLFPALVAPAITTWTPPRSRSPRLSSFRCRSISACRSRTDTSTMRGSTQTQWHYKIHFCPLSCQTTACKESFSLKTLRWTKYFTRILASMKVKMNTMSDKSCCMFASGKAKYLYHLSYFWKSIIVFRSVAWANIPHHQNKHPFPGFVLKSQNIWDLWKNLAVPDDWRHSQGRSLSLTLWV